MKVVGSMIEEKLKKIILNLNPRLEQASVDSDSSLESLGLDSLDIATLIMNIEEEYGIKLADEDVKETMTVNELQLVAKK